MELKNLNTTGAPSPAPGEPPFTTFEVTAPVAPVAPPAPPLTIPEALSLADRIKADATRTERATDAIGRVIGVKKLNFLDTNRITRVMGDDAGNPTALQQAMITASVVEIDGQRISLPSTLLQLEVLMQRLDFHGIAAALEALGRYTQITPRDQVADIKN